MGPRSPRYRDIALERGATAHRPFAGDTTLPSTAWHPQFEDVNNDGFMDLFVTKATSTEMPDYARRDPSNLLLGQADGTFLEGAEQAGIVNFDRGRGAAVADLNLDGLLDLVQVNYGAPVRIWRNIGVRGLRQSARWATGSACSSANPGESRRDRLVDRGQGRRHDDRTRGDRRWRPRRADSWGRPTSGSGRRTGRGPRHLAGRRAGAVDPGRGRPVRDARSRNRRRHAVEPPVTAARLAAIDLPDFGMPDEAPELPASLYADRLERLRERMAGAGFDRLVVYADREHSANLSYLTGFDPRFEEAILVLGETGEPAILVGNENWGTAGAAPLPMRRHRFQDLSLPSQPRDRSRPLAELLGEEGIGPGTRTGVVGWKTYASPGHDRGAGVPRGRAAAAGRVRRAPCATQRAS